MENEGKLRLLYIASILNRMTDEDHPVSTTELINILKNDYGISSHRTTVTGDIDVLRQFGMDICKIESTQNKYFVADRVFEIPELKLLIDSVFAASFLTEKKSRALIGKLSQLTDIYTAEMLCDGMIYDNGTNAENEKIYYIIDVLCRAVIKGKRVAFLYYGYDENKNLKLKNNGESYIVSPYSLVKNGEYYYLVGYSEKHGAIGSFRIERIADIPRICTEDIRPAPEDFDINEYKRSMFRMFAGEVTCVELCCDAAIMNSVIDHFGTDIPVSMVGEDNFVTSVDIAVSPMFFRWVFGFEGKIKILGPENVKERYREMILNAQKTI